MPVADGAAVPPAPAAAARRELAFAVDGLKPTGPTEFYTPETLYEKIDGRADQYLEYDVAGLACRTFALAGDARQYVDLYEYDMGNPLRAFGVYALERDPEGQPVDLGGAASDGDAYRSGASIFFRRGSVYAMTMPSDESPALAAAALALARAAAAVLPPDDAGLERRDQLPKAGQAPGTAQYALRNAMSLDFLTDAFSAEYDYEGGHFRFFIAARPDEAAARRLYHQYLEHGRKSGKVRTEHEAAGARVFEAESYGAADVIYQRGNVVGGVAQAPDAAPARKFVEAYLAGKVK
ncbi:MAG: hypothetical protein M1457_09455 [bacterium]|nr:hypothetical protein [bacterium]